MFMSEAIQEFGFDCKIRKLSPKTISNYQKQLKYRAAAFRSGLADAEYAVQSAGVPWHGEKRDTQNFQKRLVQIKHENRKREAVPDQAVYTVS